MVKKALTILSLLMLVLFSTCQKDMFNPYDLECPPEIWSPVNLHAEKNPEGIALSWEQKENHFDGYSIEVTIDSVNWSKVNQALVGPVEISYLDTIKYIGKTVQYRIQGIADKNQSNIAYSNALEIPALAAEVLTLAVTEITENTAKLSGVVTENEGSDITERGFYLGLSSDVEITGVKVKAGTGLGNFESKVEGLQSDTTYYVKAYAINLAGESRGESVTFKTLPEIIVLPAEVITLDVTEIAYNAATLNGEVTSDGGADVTGRGFYFGNAPNVANTGKELQVGKGLGIFDAVLDSLQANTTYYVNTYAINSSGEVLGEEISFTTEEKPNLCNDLETFIDPRDGHEYKKVQIGAQVWMAENLKYLPRISPSSSYDYYSPRWYVYNFSSGSLDDAKSNPNYEKYGVLYNWPAAKEACPAGWHLPTDEEWSELELFMGMSQEDVKLEGTRGTDEGSRLKAIQGWNNGNGTDEFCFGAQPGGYYYMTYFYNIGTYGNFWSSSQSDMDGFYAYSRNLASFSPSITKAGGLVSVGHAVRCIED